MRRSGELPWLQPDGKSQVTVEYDGGRPVRIDTIVVSNQHSPDVSQSEIRERIIERFPAGDHPGSEQPEEGGPKKAYRVLLEAVSLTGRITLPLRSRHPSSGSITSI
jgi:hypothetical protein